MHFIPTAKKYRVDEYATKYIVGHSIQDITKQVYTKREIDWLKKEIEKIKSCACDVGIMYNRSGIGIMYELHTFLHFLPLLSTLLKP